MAKVVRMSRLTIVVIFFNMRREAERTLFSLSTAYQLGVKADDYDVVAVDNGSSEPLNPDQVSRFGSNFRHVFFDTPSQSPASAINVAVDSIQSKVVAVIVDGARMCSPGLVRNSLDATTLNDSVVGFALSFHLGPDVQNRSIQRGYDQDAEDRLLSEIEWRKNGYGLFEVSTLAPSSSLGCDFVPAEFSWFAMQRTAFQKMGGLDIRFESPGGGLVNHDFRDRVVSASEVEAVLIHGEGVFHQVHGGVTTNVIPEHHPMDSFMAEYNLIQGRQHETVSVPNPPVFGLLTSQTPPLACVCSEKQPRNTLYCESGLIV